LTTDFIEIIIKIWKHEKVMEFTTPPTDDGQSPELEDRTQLDESDIKRIQLKAFNGG
jgi:hypothetical protein